MKTNLFKKVDWYAVALIGSAVLFACTDSSAAEIGLHLATAHEKGGYNSITPGLYIKSENSFYGLNTAGILRNSIGRTSVYLGYTFDYRNFGLTIGGITGYPHAIISPILIPSWVFSQTGPVNHRLSWLERKPDEPDSSRAIHYSLEWKHDFF